VLVLNLFILMFVLDNSSKYTFGKYVIHVDISYCACVQKAIKKVESFQLSFSICFRTCPKMLQYIH